VDQTFQQFKEVVSSARPKLASDASKFQEATTGQIFTAKQALDLGLVDRLGFVEDAVDRAIELAKLDAGQVRVVKYKKQKGLLDDALFGSSAQGQASVANLLDFASPRAYFLWTWIPAAVSSQSP
jgi:protease-4